MITTVDSSEPVWSTEADDGSEVKMSDETWARVSLRIFPSQRVSVTELGRLIGVESISQSEDRWAAELVDDSAIPLNDQILIAKDFLRGRAMMLEGLTAEGSQINLSIGWTPRCPQDGVILDTELIALLSKIGCYVLLDTYLD